MTYRLYFNRCVDFPQVWSVDEGTTATEVNVIGVRVEGHVDVTSARLTDVAGVDKGREPVAWLEVTAASVRLEAGYAVFRDALADA